MSLTVNFHSTAETSVAVEYFDSFRSLSFRNALMESVDVFVTSDQYAAMAAKLRAAADALEALPAVAEPAPVAALAPVAAEAIDTDTEDWF